MKHKYPIGTRIRFLWPDKDTNKIGKIVAFGSEQDPIIYLPDGYRTHILADGTFFTWMCGWNQIELVGQQQLEFDFML